MLRIGRRNLIIVIWGGFVSPFFGMSVAANVYKKCKDMLIAIFSEIRECRYYLEVEFKVLRRFYVTLQVYM